MGDGHLALPPQHVDPLRGQPVHPRPHRRLAHVGEAPPPSASATARSPITTPRPENRAATYVTPRRYSRVILRSGPRPRSTSSFVGGKRGDAFRPPRPLLSVEQARLRRLVRPVRRDRPTPAHIVQHVKQCPNSASSRVRARCRAPMSVFLPASTNRLRNLEAAPLVLAGGIRIGVLPLHAPASPAASRQSTTSCGRADVHYSPRRDPDLPTGGHGRSNGGGMPQLWVSSQWLATGDAEVRDVRRPYRTPPFPAFGGYEVAQSPRDPGQTDVGSCGVGRSTGRERWAHGSSFTRMGPVGPVRGQPGRNTRIWTAVVMPGSLLADTRRIATARPFKDTAAATKKPESQSSVVLQALRCVDMKPVSAIPPTPRHEDPSRRVDGGREHLREGPSRRQPGLAPIRTARAPLDSNPVVNDDRPVRPDGDTVMRTDDGIA